MTYFKKVGGVAALIEAGTLIVGFVFMFTLLLPSGYLENYISEPNSI